MACEFGNPALHLSLVLIVPHVTIGMIVTVRVQIAPSTSNYVTCTLPGNNLSLNETTSSAATEDTSYSTITVDLVAMISRVERSAGRSAATSWAALSVHQARPESDHSATRRQQVRPEKVLLC
jgi:hypothetical protein